MEEESFPIPEKRRLREERTGKRKNHPPGVVRGNNLK